MPKKDHIKGGFLLSTYTYTPSDFFAKTKGLVKGEERGLKAPSREVKTHQPTPLVGYQGGPEVP